MSDIILDLGEYGFILVESADEGWSDAGMGDHVHAYLDRVLKWPLTGLSKALLASLPVEGDNDTYRLDEFTIEFQLDLKVEAGTAVGVVAKITPGGVFSCTYTWKRRERPLGA